MLYSGTDPESYITEYILVYEDNPTPTGCLPRPETLSPAVSRQPEHCFSSRIGAGLRAECLCLGFGAGM